MYQKDEDIFLRSRVSFEALVPEGSVKLSASVA